MPTDLVAGGGTILSALWFTTQIMGSMCFWFQMGAFFVEQIFAPKQKSYSSQAIVYWAYKLIVI